MVLCSVIYAAPPPPAHTLTSIYIFIYTHLRLMLLVLQVEPMNRALKEQDSDCWINGRRRTTGQSELRCQSGKGKRLVSGRRRS